MQGFSYSHSPNIVERLGIGDGLRTEVLCTVLSTQTIQYMRWEALVNRMYSLLNSQTTTITKKEIIDVVSHPRRKAQSTLDDAVMSYKRVFDRIMERWLVTAAPVNELAIAGFSQQMNGSSLRSGVETDLQQVCSYLQNSPDHPVVSAGIAYIQVSRLAPLTVYNDWLAWIIAYVFLYRGGYNALDLLVLEQLPQKEKEWADQVERAKQHDNLTLWLEYWTHCFSREARRIRDVVVAAYQESLTGTPEFLWQLTDRQKEILVMLDQPGVRLTNKKVQKAWNVSQITASRDLTTLAGYGLIYAQGKGRSVYYTRV